MIRFGILAGIFAVSIVVMAFVSPTGAVFALVGGIAVGIGIPLLDSALVNIRFFRVLWYSLRNWSRPVRISASYLYRIRIDDAYLLVKSNRFDHYQPVGGVYKSYPSAKGLFDQLGVAGDNVLNTDDVSDGDLRLRVPGRHLLGWVKWFDSGRNREVDAWREFYEELIDSGLLPKRSFPFVRYELLARRYHPLRYSDWAGCNELLIADILEPVLTDEQADCFRALKGAKDPRFIWADEDRIRRRGGELGETSQMTLISDHSSWIL